MVIIHLSDLTLSKPYANLHNVGGILVSVQVLGAIDRVSLRQITTK
jgi:hypothetical protein